jgi:hypothetical protein
MNVLDGWVFEMWGFAGAGVALSGGMCIIDWMTENLRN